MIRTTFKYPEINDDHLTKYTFGSQNAGQVLRPDGDWRNFIPIPELQNYNGVESSACYIEAQQHSIASIQKEKYGVDANYAARFNVLLSDGTDGGGDPLKGADSIRNDGMINDEMMPFDSSITSQAEFASWKGANEKLCRAAGQLYKTKWSGRNDIVFKKDDLLQSKYANLREALKYSPCPISIYGEVDSQMQYIPKPEGVNDTHLVLALYVDENNVITIFDTYLPYIKQLPANYNSDFGMKWSVEQITTPIKMTFGQMIVDIWRKIFNRDYRLFGSVRSPKWSEIRKAHLLKQPACMVCGKTKGLNVHHKRPFNKFPALELEPSNLITLCEDGGMNCHITFGHLGNFKFYNPNVDEDVAIYNKKVKERLINK